MTYKSIISTVVICIGLSLCSVPISAQIIVEPLFNYPTAPEEIDNLHERSSWLISNFWNAMDLSTDKTVDQNALNHAFMVYTSAIQFSDRECVMQSVNSLIKQLKGKPALTSQFVKAAEESLYGPRADVWSDEVYMPFLKSMVAEKNITPIRKERYERQLKLLQSTQPGKKAPGFRYRLSNGHYRDFKPENVYTIIEFGDPECDDCAFAKLKLEMAADLREMIEDKKIKMLFIVPDVSPDEESEMMDALNSYPLTWSVGLGYGIDELYDLRQTPSFYLLNAKGEIVLKNTDVSTIVDKLRAEISEGKIK